MWQSRGPRNPPSWRPSPAATFPRPPSRRSAGHQPAALGQIRTCSHTATKSLEAGVASRTRFPDTEPEAKASPGPGKGGSGSAGLMGGGEKGPDMVAGPLWAQRQDDRERTAEGVSGRGCRVGLRRTTHPSMAFSLSTLCCAWRVPGAEAARSQATSSPSQSRVWGHPRHKERHDS